MIYMYDKLIDAYPHTMSACHLLAQDRTHDVMHLTSLDCYDELSTDCAQMKEICGSKQFQHSTVNLILQQSDGFINFMPCGRN